MNSFAKVFLIYCFCLARFAFSLNANDSEMQKQITDFEKNAGAFQLKLLLPTSPDGLFSLEIIPSDKTLKDVQVNRFAFSNYGALLRFHKNDDSGDHVYGYAFHDSHKPAPKYVVHSIKSEKIVIEMKYVTHMILDDIMNKKDCDLSKCKNISLELSFSGLIRDIDPKLRMMTNSIEIPAEFLAKMIASFSAKNIKIEDPFITYLKEQTTVIEPE